MNAANSAFRHSPGVNSLTEQSAISKRSPPRCLASMVITSCFNFLVPHTLFLNCKIVLWHSLLAVSHSRRILRPSLSMDVMLLVASDLIALASLSIRAPSFCLEFISPIWVSSSFSCALHSDFVVSRRFSVCVFSACNSPTICSSLSRNRGQFGFLDTVQKNCASAFFFGCPCSWVGNGGVPEDRLPLRATRDSSRAARSISLCLIQAFGGASSSR
mmetsp:Transcript_54151/g.144250  ORF Transcript_54151/g.144250 Transcript_54151/m.144250 type:complete len:216 (-) Transcript_54151:1375-2022(-)